MWVWLCIGILAAYIIYMDDIELDISSIPLDHLRDKLVYFPGEALSPCPLNFVYDKPENKYHFHLQQEGVRGIHGISGSRITLKKTLFLGRYIVYVDKE